jgi:hypothetical protein
VVQGEIVDYDYEVFISYSSADRAWAIKLHDGLAARGVHAFFDQASLREGQAWDKQLRDGVLGSRHLLCLWSSHIGPTSWVHQELAMFSVRQAEPSQAEGSLLTVRLDEHPNYNVSLQEFVNEPLKQAYRDGIATLGADAWNDLLDRITAAVRRVKDSISIPLAVLTLTREQADGMSAADREDIRTRLGIEPATLGPRYGPTRRDWKPFGGDVSIGTVLQQVRTSINAQLKGRTMGWDLPDDRFWSDMTQAKAFVARMVQARLGAILIDPVALSHTKVLSRVALFDACKRVDTIAIMVLPPFAASEQVTRFRAWVEEFGTATVQPYFEPPLEPDDVVLARCGMGVDHADEIRRLVQMSVGQFIRLAARGGKPANAMIAN